MEHNPTDVISQTAMNLIDQQDYSYVSLNRLHEIEITDFSNSKPEMDFVKLILAKSPMLKDVRLVLDNEVDIHGDAEVEMLKELLQYPRASARAVIRVECWLNFWCSITFGLSCRFYFLLCFLMSFWLFMILEMVCDEFD